jgi:hypothetical protein
MELPNMKIVIKCPNGAAPELYRGPAYSPIPWETIPRNKWIMVEVDPPASVGDSIAALDAAGIPPGYTFSRFWASASKTYQLLERTDDA